MDTRRTNNKKEEKLFAASIIHTYMPGLIHIYARSYVPTYVQANE